MKDFDNIINGMLTVLGNALENDIDFEDTMTIVAKFIDERNINLEDDISLHKKFYIENKVHRKCCSLKNSCLQEAILLFFTLGKMGFNPTLNIGYIKQSNKRLYAHAWLSYQGQQKDCSNCLGVIKQYTYTDFYNNFLKNT